MVGGGGEEESSSVEIPLVSMCEKEVESLDRSTTDVKREIVEEVKKQLRLAGPLVAVSLLQNSLQVISLMFVGQLRELALSSASMATSFAGVTGFSFLVK